MFQIAGDVNDKVSGLLPVSVQNSPVHLMVDFEASKRSKKDPQLIHVTETMASRPNKENVEPSSLCVESTMKGGGTVMANVNIKPDLVGQMKEVGEATVLNTGDEAGLAEDNPVAACEGSRTEHVEHSEADVRSNLHLANIDDDNEQSSKF